MRGFVQAAGQQDQSSVLAPTPEHHVTPPFRSGNRMELADASATDGMPGTRPALVPTPIRRCKVRNVTGLSIKPCRAMHSPGRATRIIGAGPRPTASPVILESHAPNDQAASAVVFRLTPTRRISAVVRLPRKPLPRQWSAPLKIGGCRPVCMPPGSMRLEAIYAAAPGRALERAAM